MSTEAREPSSDASLSPQPTLIPLPPEDPGPPEAPGGRPRVQRPDRRQVAIRMLSLDALLPEDHQARVVWDYVHALDLTPLYDQIRAVEGHVGRNAIDPKILMALWLYATLDGEGSARRLDQLCKDHVVYQWICGGVSVNYHTLSDFRTAHPQVLDEMLTQSVASLVHEGLVTMERVAQDGMRVRASAGAASFRRAPTLQECQAQAKEQVEALQKELEANPGASSKRQQAARRRAARERAERIARAMEEVAKVEAKKKADEKEKARASTTDPDARVMKMPDGGYRPAQNVQFVTDTASQIVTDVNVLNTGSDLGQMGPMVEQHEERYGQPPKEILVDGGFAKREDIEKVTEGGTTVYAPVQKPRNPDQDRHEPRPRDSEVVAAWRVRMGTDEAKAIYKERASTAECVNAISRNRGLTRFLVRGLAKVRCVGLWHAIAHNLVRAATLRAVAALRAEAIVIPA